VGSNSWSNPNNVFANDNTLTSLSTKGVTHYIASSGYGFSIPSPANITGISVEVLRGASGVQNVSLLNSWTNGLTKTVSAGVNRCLIVVVALETGTDLREVSSMTYGGQAMTQLANVASVSGFYARLQVWALTETGIAAATSTTISPVYSGTLHAEYCENFSAASFANVDQYSLSSHTVESYLNSPPSATYQLEGPLSTLTGSMSIAAVMTGNRPTAAPAIGGSGDLSVNSSFTSGSNIYFANASYSTTGACVLTAHKASSSNSTEQPTFTFAGPANRFTAVGISLRRARNMDNLVYLTKAGTIVGSNYANTGAEWPTANAYTSYGGSSNLWGTTWTVADINNSGFGARVSAIVQNGTANIDHIRITVWYASTLPIELQSFDAYPLNESVSIEWQTSAEINNDYFTVERSGDAKSWDEIRNIAGAGNSNQLIYYSIIDNKPFSGLSYYRLKQTDYDGDFSYSNSVIVNFESQDGSVVLYPKPAQNYISVKSKSDVIRVIIHDASGQILKEYKDCNGRLDISTLNPGVYYVEVVNTADSHYSKLYVSK
jgi:hypothetical protein